MSNELERIRLRLKVFPLVDESLRKTLEFMVLHLCDERAQEVVPDAETRGFNEGLETAAKFLDQDSGDVTFGAKASERAFFIRAHKRSP